MDRSTMRAGAAGAVLLLAALAGCGGDGGSSESSAEPTETTSTSTEDYCAALEEAKAQVDSLNSSDIGALEDVFATFRGLAERAPQDVAAEWDTLVTGFDRLQQTVEDAGLTLDQLAKIQANPDPQNLPEGVDLPALQQLGAELQALQTPEFTQAGDAISKHAQQECGINLDGSGSGAEAPSDDSTP